MNFSLTEEQHLLQNTIADLNRREISPRAEEMDSTGRLPDDLIQSCARLGLLGMGLPSGYGGSAATGLDNVLAIEQLAYSGTALWWLAAFCDSIPECILRFGSAAQKARYLPPICRGESIPSFQFTEADTGSDPEGLKTRVQASESDALIINGMKRFSTFGSRPGCAIVFALDERRQCNAFIIEKNETGYHATADYPLMGSGGIEAADVYYDDYHVGRSAVFGQARQGLSILQHWIHSEKLQQCAACVGIAQAALDEAVTYAKARMVKGKAQARLQGIRWMMADMHARLEAARWLSYRAAYLKDTQAANWMTEAAAAKLFVVPATMQIVEESRRIHGSYGYTKGYKIERLYRAIAGASAIAVSLEINKSIVAAALLQ